MSYTMESHDVSATINAETADRRRQKQPPLVDRYPLLELVPATPTLLVGMGWPADWGIKWVLVEKGTRGA